MYAKFLNYNSKVHENCLLYNVSALYYLIPVRAKKKSEFHSTVVQVSNRFHNSESAPFHY